MKAWKDFVDQQEKLLGKETTDKWLRSLKVVTFDSCNLYLEATDSFQISWFEEHLRPKIKKTFFNNNYRPIKVHLSTPHNETKPKETALKPQFFLDPDPIDEKCTFLNFIANEQNNLPYKFLVQHLNNPQSSFNPIYIYGPEGVGKTHLLMACANELLKKNLKIFYVQSKTFTNHVVRSIRLGFMDEFRKAYRNIDVLLIDDIDEFANKNATQEELFHTFNTLHVQGKQIILSAKIAPLHLEKIEPRLVSRFEWGIELKIERSNKEDLEKIILERVKSFNISFKKEVIDFLITTFNNNPKTIQQAIEALVLRTHLGGQKTTFDLSYVKDHLKDLIFQEDKKKVSLEKIISSVALYYEVDTNELLGKSQCKSISYPRQLCMYLLRNDLQISYQKISKIFSRDHSTVISSIKKIENDLTEKKDKTCQALLLIKKNIDKVEA